MALIRRADAALLAKDAIVLDLADLRRQGEKIIQTAREQARALLENAEREKQVRLNGARVQGFEAGRKEGYERGLAEGRERGQADAVRELGEQLARLSASWQSALDQFERDRADMLDEARADVVELAVAIAQRVTRRAIRFDPQTVRGPLEAALEQVMRASRLVIHVHPDDLRLTQSCLPELAARFSACEHAEVIPDPTLERGGCVIRTPSGHIDASVDGQLERIIQAIVPERASEPNTPTHAADSTDPGDRTADGGHQSNAEPSEPAP